MTYYTQWQIYGIGINKLVLYGEYMGKLDKLSVFISLVLRHKPDAAGITLDEHGWANVEELLDGINNTGRKIDIGVLE